jgi:hypothetical protein
VSPIVEFDQDRFGWGWICCGAINCSMYDGWPSSAIGWVHWGEIETDDRLAITSTAMHPYTQKSTNWRKDRLMSIAGCMIT